MRCVAPTRSSRGGSQMRTPRRGTIRFWCDRWRVLLRGLPSDGRRRCGWTVCVARGSPPTAATVRPPRCECGGARSCGPEGSTTAPAKLLSPATSARAFSRASSSTAPARGWSARVLSLPRSVTPESRPTPWERWRVWRRTAEIGRARRSCTGEHSCCESGSGTRAASRPITMVLDYWRSAWGIWMARAASSSRRWQSIAVTAGKMSQPRIS